MERMSPGEGWRGSTHFYLSKFCPSYSRSKSCLLSSCSGHPILRISGPLLMFTFITDFNELIWSGAVISKCVHYSNQLAFKFWISRLPFPWEFWVGLIMLPQFKILKCLYMEEMEDGNLELGMQKAWAWKPSVVAGLRSRNRLRTRRLSHVSLALWAAIPEMQEWTFLPWLSYQEGSTVLNGKVHDLE